MMRRATGSAVSGSPDIAWKSDLNLIYNKDKGELAVSGYFSGKGFPSFEGFIEDAAGNKAFLGVLSPDNVSQITRLIYNSADAKTIDVVGVSFSVDKSGNFTDVTIDLGKEKKSVTWNSGIQYLQVNLHLKMIVKMIVEPQKNSHSMRFYQSPLSIGGTLFLIVGLYFIWAMFRGTYPTIFFFIILGMGIAMLLVDYFIRKSGLSFGIKLTIQTLCVFIPLLIAVLYFRGIIR